jgi:hypothetical protein
MPKNKRQKLSLSGTLEADNATIGSGNEPEFREITASDSLGVRIEELPPAIRMFERLPDDHPFYGIVGRVASEWSHVEHILDAIIWKLAGTGQNKAACITSQIMGVGPRCKAIHNLCKLHGLQASTLKKIRALMSDSYPIADLRARVVHDPWYIDTGTESPGQFRAMPYSDPQYGHLDISKMEIEATLIAIHKIRDQATNLRKQIHAEFEALHKRQP